MARIYDFEHPHESSARRELTELLGGKGANLAAMTTELGLAVPPGFTITTDVCREYLEAGWPEGLDDELVAAMQRLETAAGRRFGDAEAPLLVSVRSGAAISMPGMMDTILNVGLDGATTAGLAAATGDPEFAADCRARLDVMYREIVGRDVPADPWEQLREAVEAVFRSWNSERANAYRQREGIADDTGTAVNVQAMVFGNLDDESATGVVFTRDPATGENVLYGDVMYRAQGEDVVSGTQTPERIASLDEEMPEVAAQLREQCRILEHHYRDMCDIEFTVERGRLWLLQVRVGKRTPQAALRIAIEMAEEDGFPLSRADAVRRVATHLLDPPMQPAEIQGRDLDLVSLGSGMGASPGTASGKVATTPDGAVALADAGHPVILVRRETSPEDVHGMSRAAGILTSTGGQASHAAVVARGWGIPAVVGAQDVVVDDARVVIGGRRLEEDDFLTIDGGSGEIFLGLQEMPSAVAPDASLLLSWARELGVDLDQPAERSGPVTQDDSNAPTMESVVRALVIKGFATAELLAPAVVTSVDALQPVLESMASQGLVSEAATMYQLTDEGREQGMAALAEDREHWGLEAANAALDDFLPLDLQMKEVVTAWQMVPSDGEPVLNDHSDEEYDRGVLATFAALHRDVVAWLGPLHDGLARLEAYSVRLDAAAASVAEGDHRFIASPVVDSYHSIWFELHEDLIHLAGRTREDEVASGRA